MDRQYLMPRNRPKLLVAVIAGAIVLASGGYGVYQSTTTPGSSASTDTRQTYTNAEAGYSLMYPNDWKSSPAVATADGTRFTLTSPDFAESQYRQIPVAGAQIIVSSKATTATSAAAVLTANDNYARSAGSVRSLVIAGRDARSFVISGGITGDRRTVVVSDGREYELRLVTPAGTLTTDTATASSYESIVKSFKLSR